jgi:hypothetical protein
MAKIMRNANPSEGRVFDVVRLKQGGICRFCNESISKDDEVVSSGKNKKYYHRRCAKKLNII